MYNQVSRSFKTTGRDHSVCTICTLNIHKSLHTGKITIKVLTVSWHTFNLILFPPSAILAWNKAKQNWNIFSRSSKSSVCFCMRAIHSCLSLMYSVLCVQGWISPTITCDPTVGCVLCLVLKMEYTSDHRVDRQSGRNPALYEIGGKIIENDIYRIVTTCRLWSSLVIKLYRKLYQLYNCWRMILNGRLIGDWNPWYRRETR